MGAKSFRGKLFRSSEDSDLGEDVVCKVAYHPTALSCIDHETAMYYELQHLQGVCIPVVHGYYLHQDRLASRSCLVLAYCGEPIKKAFAELDTDFKRALVQAATYIHDAGVMHNNLVEENVLDYHGLPMIIDLEEAQEHLCGRDGNIIEGDIAPRSDDFKCDELFQLCDDVKYWKPRMIKSAPIHRGMTAEDLADTYPAHIPRDVALKKAKAAIKDHVKRYYPERYKEWERQQLARSRSQKSDKAASSSSSQTTSPAESNASATTPQDLDQ